MYLLTVSSWLVVCMFAALPFLLTQHISYTDSFFESMSGITATGSTVLSGLDSMSPGILMWRSLLHWLGGIGFIGMAVAILPLLRIGGMRLFQTESSDRSEKVMPRSHMVARLIVAAYVGITILGSLAFWWAGMSLFDAINHAMSAISTGGFSTSDQSLAKWTQPAVHWVAVVIMILGSLPFTLYVATLRGNRRALIKDQQVQGLARHVAGDLAGAWHLVLVDHQTALAGALRHVALNVTSVVTTTGFALGDYSLWGNFSLMLFFYLGFVGGCSGSTAGGIKIFRFQVAYILLKANLNQLIHPRAVIKQKYNGHRLDEEIVRSILTFSFFFAITICVIALLLSLLGVDWMTALTGAASTVSGVGPGLGETIGPAGNFATLPDAAKWILSFGMLWADWRSLRCLFCAFRRSGVTDRRWRFHQSRPVFAGRGIEPAPEGAEEVARIGKPQQVGNFQQGHARLRQILLGQFAAGVVEQCLKTRALFLQASLQGTLRQVQGLRHGVALGFALWQQTA
jgi:trk system potassium uptake protein TrkH